MAVMYACTRCGERTDREELSSKKVMFAGIGASPTVFRSRTVEWLCEKCLGQDADYNYPKDTSREDRMRRAAARRQEKAKLRNEGR